MSEETKQKNDENATKHLSPKVRKVYFTGVVRGLEEQQLFIEGQLLHASAALALADDELANQVRDNDHQPKEEQNHE